MVRTACGRPWAQACALVIALVLSGPRVAQAWTNTELRSADAHLHVWPSGRALVALTLELSVRGGWLSRFEIAGLDPDARLDPDKPPWLLCEDGRKVAPRARVRPDGTLVLEFEREDAPRRGRHLLGVVYGTHLASSAAPSGPRRMSWFMPAWRGDLEDVDLWINAPAGTRIAPGEEAELDGAVARTQVVDGARTVLHLHRVQLPRTMPFGIELDLPAAGTQVQPARARTAPQDARTPAPLWLGGLVAVLVWLKRSSVRARGARRGERPVPLIALGAPARGLLVLGFALTGALAYPRVPALALALLASAVLLGLDRGFAPARRPARPIGSRLFERWYELFGPTSWLDATTPPGALLVASAYALGLLRLTLGGGIGPWLELLLLVTPLWLTATRLHAARTPQPRVSEANPAGSESDFSSLLAREV